MQSLMSKLVSYGEVTKSFSKIITIINTETSKKMLLNFRFMLIL